jgi:hypothetical protein
MRQKWPAIYIDLWYDSVDESECESELVYEDESESES